LLLLLMLALHRFDFIKADSFINSIMVSFGIALIGFALAIKGFVDLWSRGDKGGRSSIKGMILSFFTLIPIGLAGGIWLFLPTLNDISSDLDNPPSYLTSLLPLKTLPAQILASKAQLQSETWPDLRGRRYEISPDRILTAIETVMNAQGWKIQEQFHDTDAENNDIFMTTDTSIPVLGFDFEVIVRISDQGEATWVDMRVTARDLSHDLGFGAYIINHFMQDLDREVLLSAIERVSDD